MKLDCSPGSLAGPIDRRAIRSLERYRKFRFPKDFIAALPSIHGGIPVQQFFRLPNGDVHRIGRFLPIYDDRSMLSGPKQPSWEFPEMDFRVTQSIETLIDQEGPSCRSLFSGERLMPIAALCVAENHPDDMSLTSADCDLICFDNLLAKPTVVLWKADLANQTSTEREHSEAWDAEVEYSNFTEHVAESFTDFSSMLRESP